MRTDPVLLVDDSPDDVFLTIRAFRKNGVQNEMIVARDGVEALELLHPADGSEPLSPAFVLLDVNMPRMGGLEVVRRLREHDRTRFLPIIMLTTSTEPGDVAASYAGGANSYIAKPVVAQEFADIAGKLSGYWLDLNVHADSRPRVPRR